MRPRIRVLIADDADDIRFLLRLSLASDRRFEVVGEAPDGAVAWELTEREAPDAVVLDLSMPVMDGLQAAAQIREQRPGTKIVVLSGFAAERMSAKALAAGADRYLEKGAAMKDLAQALAELCGAPDPQDDPVAEAPRSTPAPAAVGANGAAAAKPAGEGAVEVMSFVSHELQTPLTALKGFAAVLKSGIDRMDREQIVASAAAIERSADNLTALTRSFADARAVEAGSLGLDRSTVVLDELIRQTVADLSTVTHPHPVAVHAAGPLEVSGDPVRLRQVITNLVSNAAKFSPSEAPIEVQVTVAGAAATLAVVDHGPGVPPHREHELFQKFARLDSTAKGTGLGLYISRGIARAHGGDLTYAPTPGGGATFRLELPVQKA